MDFASPSNLFTNPWWRSTSSTMTAKKPVEQVHHLGRGPTGDQLRGADDVDEDHRDMALLTTQLGALLLGRRGDLTSDVAAEEVPDTFAFAQPVDHCVTGPGT